MATPSASACGQQVMHYLNTTSCNHKHPEDCEREYSVYVPKSICKNDDNRELVPTMFALHCFGCDMERMFRWSGVAEKYGFILVVPVGVQNSWNAKACCGKAMEREIDDVGFLELIIRQMHTDYSFVSADHVYGTGWSNGGYLVTYASRLFKAISPVSGHQYDDFEAITGGSPVPMMLHHSRNDPVVSFNGCCENSTCCCHISERSEVCASVPQVTTQWATDVNKCIVGQTIGRNGLPSEGTRVSLTRDDGDKNEFTCTTFENCEANTTICIHEEAGHFNRPAFSSAFPLFDEVGDFFASHACGGTWKPETRKCECPGGKSGQYCHAGTKSALEPLPVEKSTAWLWMLTGIFGLSIVAWALKKKTTLSSSPRGKYRAVSRGSSPRSINSGISMTEL